MRNKSLRSAIVLMGVAALSLLALAAHAQTQTPSKNATPTATPNFSPRDLNGVYVSRGGGGGGARGATPANGANGGNAATQAQGSATTPTAHPPAAARGPNNGATHPPFTPWAQARFDAAIPSLGPRDIPGKENDPVLRCDPDGFPKIFGSPEPFEIVMTPKRMFEFFEKDHIWREIWLDGRALPKDPDPTWNGTSVGHWEGDTLVVDTIGFNDTDWLDYFGDPHSEHMHLIEKYRKVDADTLELQITVDDPGAYTQPWVFPVRQYALKPDWEIHEWYCTQEDTESYDDRIRLPSGGVTPPSGK